MRLKPYPEYKDSGLSWLGEIPAHWKVRRLRSSVLECRNGIWGDDPDGNGDIACVRVADFDRYALRVRFANPTMRAVSPSERHRRLLWNGDLLLEKSGGGELQAVGAVMLFDHDAEAICSNFVARMPVAPRFDPSYLTYLHSHLYSIQLNMRSIKQTTGIQNLDSDAYLNELVAFPNEAEQRNVARFLDILTVRVSRLIRAKQRLIELLNEQKQAIIHRAVTRGLDPDAPTKPTGLDWPPEVPQHWQVFSLGRFITLQRGIDITKDSQTPGPIPVVSSGGIHSYHNRSTSSGPGVLVGRKGSAGTVYFVESAYWAHDTTLWVARFGGNNPRFVYYILKQLDLRRFDTGSANPTINRNIVHPEPVAFPPPDEQKEIALYLDDVSKGTDKAIQRARREIELIREYRTRLISEVVTGKLDVRGVELPEPDTGDDGVGAGLDGLESVAADVSPEPEEVQDVALRYQ